MNKTEALALKNRYLSKVSDMKEKARQGVDVAEIGTGAALAGYMDVVAPSIMGIPASAGLGIALFVAGQMTEQRDIGYVGVGLLAGAAYKQGAALALGVAAKDTVSASAKSAV